MFPFRARSLIAAAAAVAGALPLVAAAPVPAVSARTGSALAATLNCAGSIRVNVTSNGAVDGKGDLRCATPTTSYDGQLTLSGTATVSGRVYQARTSDRLSIFSGSSGEIIDLAVNRRLERLSDAASGNATEQGTGTVVGGGPFGGARETESGTGTFGTGMVTTFLITNNYILDLNG
ncbi:hypothetical protein [Streptomyces telluris]|uniref:Secreted protein n=1 Tax=Streptomyces telluris TaxID=2720021 RepID=A0A9X2LHP5_9ACTN|nr:hypothetical protein [Streptomyces telluris]MCQ8771666.1 hypothetical protein [Streptomyces telluris]NJP79252.1 hypothetical protein [Streptomyces telluris]